LSPADTVQIPSGQRDDNRRGGEEAEGKGRNRAAVEGYIGDQPWGLEAESDSATRPVIDRQPTEVTLLPSVYDQRTSISTLPPPQTSVGSKNRYQTPSLFSPIWSIDSAYGTRPVTASYCPETPPTTVTAEKIPVSFADDDVVIPPSGTVDPAKLDDEDRDTVVETGLGSSDKFVTALPVRQTATSTRLHKKMLLRRCDAGHYFEFFDSATEEDNSLDRNKQKTFNVGESDNDDLSYRRTGRSPSNTVRKRHTKGLHEKNILPILPVPVNIQLITIS